MKKAMIIISICVILLLPVLIYSGIVITNNWIAASVARELEKTPLPENTTFFGSVSAAGHLTGNGNGMQYMGSILVISDLTEEELYEHYSESFEYVEVRRQKSQVLDFLNTNQYSFELFGDPECHTHYSITCWGSPKDYHIGGFAAALLNLDIRGF